MATKVSTFETPSETYTVTKTIGEGGAGRVYEVASASGDLFALKCLTADRITPERLKRFRNEIEFCRRCDHANIVRVLDVGIAFVKKIKCPFYVMNRYAGTLRTHIGRLDPNDIVRAFSQMLDGVEAAHLSRVWHRDLKPENVLWNEAEKALVVADFGIAHFEAEEIYTAVETKVASRMANFQYSAPEQRARGMTVDGRADIFSLGLILNEMFTGDVPQGSGYKRINDFHADHGYLDAIVDSMIQQNPQNRPNSVEAIKKELIGQKNAFVALQQYDQIKRQVINVATPPEFDPITCTDFDYYQGLLTLKLSRNVPPGWAQKFQHPRGEYASYRDYGPGVFQISGDTASIRVRNDDVQQVVDLAKQYSAAANRGHVEQLRDHAAHEDRLQRTAWEKELAERELRKTILAKVKL